MAERVIKQLISDLSGKDIDEGDGRSVDFSYDGKSYRIDLTNAEADKFDKAMQQYVEVAARVTNGARRSPARKSASSSGDAAKIREWAQAQGMDVPERGRISSDVREAYDKAH